MTATKQVSLPRPASGVVAATAVLALLLPLLTAAQGVTAQSPFFPDEQRVRYDQEYPAIGYTSMPRDNRVARLQARLDAGTAKLEFSDKRGYLDSLLQALDIDVSSQMLVFSKTSIQAGRISPKTPRALYFNDDTYVGYVRGGPLEIATMDARLGPVFYTLAQQRAGAAFHRELKNCLRCHDSLTLTGGGVPRFMTGSGYIDTAGNIIGHEGWILTSYKTELKFRWGGWYVTGTHGKQVHLGNIVVKDPSRLWQLDELRNGNLTSLDGLVDTSPYPVATSDIVALLVLDQQITVQNAITRARYDLSNVLNTSGRDGGPAGAEAPDAAPAPEQIAKVMEPLVRTMLFVGEPPLTDTIKGTSGFADEFQRQGVTDSRGRSLRRLDLRTRLFRYPLSYLIYSPAFDALPETGRDYVYRRLNEVLGGADHSDTFAYLTADEKNAILDILRETKPEFRQWLARAD